MRVVIIDDHPVFRRAAHELLERRGFLVVAEADGAASALEAVARSAPDAALVDIWLGDGDGFDVCRELLALDPGLAVLLTSTNEIRGGAAQVRDCGARGFVLKSKLAAVDLAGLWNGAAGAKP
jgi:DNA-binding NarL/FixJ family response regulator